MERSVLVLYHQEERSYQQIAESLQPADRHGSNASAPRTEQAAQRAAAHEGRHRHERSTQTRTNSELDGIVQALETAPEVSVPDDFTARVMALVPQEPQARITSCCQASGLGKRAWAGHWHAQRLLILVTGMLPAGTAHGRFGGLVAGAGRVVCATGQRCCCGWGSRTSACFRAKAHPGPTFASGRSFQRANKPYPDLDSA